MTDAPLTREQILAQSIASREYEVMMYQINIDNYIAAIASIDANHGTDPDMVEFRARLDKDLTDTRREQGRAQLMLEAASEQLNAIRAAP